MSIASVRVPLGDRSYDIYIGEDLLTKAGALLAPHLKRPRTVVVTDTNVYAAQGDKLKSGLAGAEIDAEFIVLDPGEAPKSFAQLQQLLERLLDLGVERDDVVTAFGGGVIGDLTGFACAILRRGCRFAQIPTTLLSQVDSAVGGKTAINAPQGKNLIGAFHQPDLVIADISSLRTLPKRELRAGYAEVVKYGLISDSGFFNWLEANSDQVMSDHAEAQINAVRKSCEAKAKLVSADERERGARALLNLGHTFGHAFEAHFGYSDRLLHGEGVALGCVLAFEYSAQSGLCSTQDVERVKAHISRSGLPADIRSLKSDITAEQIFDYMLQDKKVEQGKLTLILARAIGEAVVTKDASIADLKTFLKEKTGR